MERPVRARADGRAVANHISDPLGVGNGDALAPKTRNACAGPKKKRAVDNFREVSKDGCVCKSVATGVTFSTVGFY